MERGKTKIDYVTFSFALKIFLYLVGGNTQVQQQVAIAPQPNAVVQQVAPTTQQGQQMPAAEPAANAAISSVNTCLNISSNCNREASLCQS